jgi:hypothetical protein
MKHDRSPRWRRKVRELLPSRRVFALSLCVGAGVVVSSPSVATDGIVCSGTIVDVGVHGTDRVMLQLSGMNTIVNICNLGVTVGTTYPNPPEQCKADYGTLLTAYALGKTISVYFDNVVNGTSCTTFASWELAVVRWVHLN